MWLNDLYHSLDPIALAVGPFAIRWYGLAYLTGFVLAGVLMYRIARRWELPLSVDDVMTLITGLACGVIVGGRIGYVVFYGKGYYLAHPLAVFMLNKGGMSFHGGLVGAVVGLVLAARTVPISLGTALDLVAICAPLGLALGRCANFVNGELWGKETSLPWGVMFDTTGGGTVYRHPSQLYEALLEGVVLFCVQYLLSRRVPPRVRGIFSGIFLTLYGLFRMCIEFVRLPDSQMGYLAWDWLTMGQLLSVPLVVAGILMLVVAQHKKLPQE